MTIKTKLTSKIRRASDTAIARKITRIGLIICVVMVTISLTVAFVSEPHRVARRKFKKLAVEYYENYFYPQFVKEIKTEDFAKRMSEYSEVGVQNVYLRQLLLYNNGMNRGYEKYFAHKGFACDKNRTYAEFFPEVPYGATDYRVVYHYSCTGESGIW